ncbi:hypothetical protein BgiMline_034027, partial [Biomphalaria glabrata]
YCNRIGVRRRFIISSRSQQQNQELIMMLDWRIYLSSSNDHRGLNSKAAEKLLTRLFCVEINGG